MEKTLELFTLDKFYSEQRSKLDYRESFYICEVAGKDSIAAIIQAVRKYDIKNLLGIGIFHRSFFGNISEPIEHFKSVKDLILQEDIESINFLYLDVSNLFDLLIVRNMAIVQKYFGYYSPCPSCHLFFHMMRIPVAEYFGITKIISGEREYHGDRKKLNQLPEVLSLFKELLQNLGIKLIQPIRKIRNDEEIFKILGSSWKSAEPFRCSFSKNYYDETGEIPFEIQKILNSLKRFYFPLFLSVVEYIEINHKEPEEKWLNDKIKQIVSLIDKII
ncbi:hypothetical protein DSAG12_02405 [Promethearchaeum syntrophicum]|uniref:Uncharacterized protein n=1 Tax=Promethearchaeum syntrophicum TaxID=2594042 RepID=A0A5B9DC51_9ARCH|nr:hypothetical protein [Candidatus Prometheoarchaeum syntrophicum]